MPQRGWKPADTAVNLSAAIGRKLPAGGKKEAVGKKYAVGDKKDEGPPEAKQKRLSENFPSKAKQMNQLNRFMARSGPCEINTSAASPAPSSASISNN